MGVFDQAARYAAQEAAEPVVARLVRGRRESLRFREWVESRTTPLPGERDRTADRVAALLDEAAPEQPWLLLAEFQAEHDPDKLDVTLIEVARLRMEVRHGPNRKSRYKVLAAMIYLRGRCPDAELDMTVGDECGTWHKPAVWNLEDDEAAPVLDEVAANPALWGQLFWIPLMRRGDDPAIIARWKELVAALPEGRRRGDLGTIALIFAELAGRYVAWEQGLRGLNMTESQVVNRWIKEAEDRARLEQARSILLQILEDRFPGRTSTEVASTINAQPSLALLRDWVHAATKAANFEQFLAILRQ
jgi:hypothetical protein